MLPDHDIYIAMGTRVAPSLANIFMAKFEEEYLPRYHLQPLLFKRYIDDCFILFTHGREELDEWANYLNSRHPSIKFTFEISEDSVNFLSIWTKKVNSFGQIFSLSPRTVTIIYILIRPIRTIVSAVFHSASSYVFDEYAPGKLISSDIAFR